MIPGNLSHIYSTKILSASFMKNKMAIEKNKNYAILWNLSKL